MKKLEEISTRLKIAKEKYTDTKKKKTDYFFLGNAFKISTELVASVVIASFIGFILDNFFDTKPWLIICFFFLGVIAGILNAIRSAKKMHNLNTTKNK